MPLQPLPGGQAFSEQPETTDLPEGKIITLGDIPPTVDPASGAMKIETDGGSVMIDLNPFRPSKTIDESDFDSNLAEIITPTEQDRIANEVLEGIAADDQSRQEWVQNRARGIDMLGFKLEQPRDDAGSSTAPLEGMSTVRHTLLPEAVIRFQAAAAAELLPAEGPVKVRNDEPPRVNNDPLTAADGPPPVDMDVLAAALEKDMNHYLTVVDKGYRPDTERMLFWCGFGGSGFKKVYWDPVKRMPISRSVDANDLIVSNAANELDDALRVTHRIYMNKSTMVRMQIAGVYRGMPDVPMPSTDPNQIEEKVAEVQGFQPRQQRPDDVPFMVYECYTNLIVQGDEHRDEDGNLTGLPLPYRVTVEKDSRRVLEIRRMWKQEDPMCMPRRVFVRFPFIDAMGIYGVGLLHVLGNADRALTTAWRIMLDTGMFANFPGFMYSDSVARQNTNEFRVPPGGGVKINTGGQPISNFVIPLPYKDVGQGLMQLCNAIEQDGQRLGGTAELQVGEGRQDAPVGTTMAMIEQATKILAAVHIRLHAAQSEEFMLLKDLLREYPEALWQNNKRPARKWEADEFQSALDCCDMVPAADPNTPSRMHRIMKAQALLMLMQAAPTLYNARAVHEHLLKVLGAPSPDIIMTTPQEQQQMEQAQQQQMMAAKGGQGGAANDPSKLLAIQQRAQQTAAEAQQHQQEMAMDAAQQARADQARFNEIKQESADRAADRQSREQVAMTQQETERLRLQATQEQHQAKLQLQAQQNATDVAQQNADRKADMINQSADRSSDLISGMQEQRADLMNNAADRRLEYLNNTQQRAHDSVNNARDRQNENMNNDAERRHKAALADAERRANAENAKAGRGMKIPNK